MLLLNVDHHIFFDEVALFWHQFSNFIDLMITLNNHARKTKGYFWCAATGNILVKDQTPKFNFISIDGTVFGLGVGRESLFLYEDFQVVNLERPMRNSGNILAHARSTLVPSIFNRVDISKIIQCNQQLYPQGFEVIVKTATISEEMFFQCLSEAFKEMKKFEGYVVVIFPVLLEQVLTHIEFEAENVFLANVVEVAKDSAFKEIVRYLPPAFDELPADLEKFQGVLITNQDFFQGSEAKFVIAVSLPEVNAYSTFIHYKSNAALRCVTKLIVVEFRK